MGASLQLPWEEDNVAEAMESDDLQLLRRLVAERAEMNAYSRSSGCSALSSAAASMRPDIVELLLAARAEVDTQDDLGAETEGRTALHQAALAGCSETSRCLLQRRADPELQDAEGHTALHCASLEGRCEVLRVLTASRADVEAKVLETPAWGCRALHLAVIAGRHDAARCLLDAKASANETSTSEVTPIHVAALRGRANFIPLLLEARGDPEARVIDLSDDLVKEDEDFPETPLIATAFENDPDPCKVLLESRARIDAVDRKRRTALMMAAESGSTAVMRLLVEQRADLEVRDSRGCTALVRACEASQEEAAALLRRLGADDAAKDSEGVTARELMQASKGRGIELPDTCRFFSASSEARTPDLSGRRKVASWIR
eukprot:TRINITY_DN62714_c0_g1_i1.p1 TRINITY_DN62714_c0_g1~~TRINITY_DN62714_c0_g1_i1.p1  ORF type:complete len:376 (+),score=105.23 TRINITY_DN62714_c0_g1_i1:72-1199(+)